MKRRDDARDDTTFGHKWRDAIPRKLVPGDKELDI